MPLALALCLLGLCVCGGAILCLFMRLSPRAVPARVLTMGARAAKSTAPHVQGGAGGGGEVWGVGAARASKMT